MFGQLSCNISNDHLDPTVLAEAGSQILLSGETVSFLSENILLHFLHTHGMESYSQELLIGIEFGLPSGRYLKACEVTRAWVVRAKTALTDVALSSCHLGWTFSSLVKEAAVQPWSLRVKLKTLRHHSCKTQHWPQPNCS